MTVFTRPMIALSLTEPDVGLLRYAAAATDLRQCERVGFVHVVPDDQEGPSEAVLAALRERMEAEVKSHFRHPGANLTFDVVYGSRLDQLLALSLLHHSDVIVLGHRQGRSGQRSLARRLAMVGTASVWLVPEGAAARLSNILVPVDFSSHSADALSFAAWIAAHQGLKQCMALHVFFDPSSVRYREHVVEVLGRETEVFDEFLGKIDLHGVKVEELLEESTHPPEAILRVAARQQADLIVMNTRGRSRAAAILLGSITSKVMEHATLPVLVVKHFGKRMSLVQAILHHRTWEAGSPKSN